jgi:hypothetical protein
LFVIPGHRAAMSPEAGILSLIPHSTPEQPSQHVPVMTSRA